MKTSNIITTDDGPQKSRLCKNNLVYGLACPLGDGIFDNNNVKNK